MNFDGALRRYKQNRFTDLDVTRCTGLSLRGWRELIKFGSVRTVTETGGRGHVRLCDATVFKRTTVIAALNRAGFSLAVSGQIAYFLPYHTLLYEICDPRTILLQVSADGDTVNGIPARVKQPAADWFDLDKPAKADPKTDWLIEIYDGQFVGAIYNTEREPLIFGDLREAGTKFVAWFPLDRQPQFSGATEEIVKQLLPDRFTDFVAEWENPLKWSAELDLIDYKVENHADSDPLRIAAEFAARGPVFKVTINVALAIRKALRRCLGIEPPMSGSEMEARQMMADVGSSATPRRKQKQRRKSEN